MAFFCLVHGSTQSPDGWRLLVHELARRGHESITVDLLAAGADVSAARYADAIADGLARARRRDAIVVAHSASGLYLPLVPERHPVSRLVFLAAFVPSLGTSPMDQFRADPVMFNPGWIGRNPNDDAVAREFLFHDCPPDVLDWALTTRRLMYAQRALRETYPLDKWPATPAASIVCADDRTITPAWSRRVARERLGVAPMDLPGGHCPHVSRPSAVADLLEAAARTV